MGGEEINTSNQIALANKTKQNKTVSTLRLLFRICEFRNQGKKKGQSGKKGQKAPTVAQQ